MAEISIVIASLDSKYISSLELCFTKGVNSGVDLEVITDYEYFKYFFNTPKRIDCLIIDENLYMDMVDKQHISNIFVLCEEPDESVQKSHNIEFVFKYSSVKEIFHKVIGRLDLHVNTGDSRGGKSIRTNMIMVYSPIGGVGKTTVALGLAKQMSDLNKRVLYLNLQSMQDYQSFIGNFDYCDSSYERILSRKDDNIANEISKYVSNIGFYCMKPLKGPMHAYGLTDEHYIFLVNKMAESKLYDYIIIDTSSDFGTLNIGLMKLCSRVVLVGEQGGCQEFKLRQFLQCIDYSEDKFLIVYNKYDEMKTAVTLEYSITEFVYDLHNPDTTFFDICNNNMLKITTLVIL